MARTVNKLIEQSFKKATLFTQDRSVDGTKTVEALDMLNDILDENSGEGSYIAFYQILTFPMVANQRIYTVGRNVGNDVDHNRIVTLKEVALITTDTRYPVKIIDDTEYYSVIYYESSQGRPSSIFLQNDIGQSTLTFISAPDIAYDCEIKAKFVLSDLTLNSDITNVPTYYLQYLKYSLAKELALEYLPKNWTPAHESRLVKLENHLRMMNDYDATLRVSNALIGRRQWYYNNLGVTT